MTLYISHLIVQSSALRLMISLLVLATTKEFVLMARATLVIRDTVERNVN